MDWFSKNKIRMNRSVLVLLCVAVFFLSAIITLVYYQVYVARSYSLQSEVACDPAQEECFVRECTEDCDESGEPDYYKIQHINAGNVSTCNPLEGECPEIDCSTTPSCSEEFCDEANVPEGEMCNDPGTYGATHPALNSGDAGSEGE